MLQDDEIKAMEERERLATPGPWTVAFNKSMRSAWAIVKAGTSTPVLNLDSDRNVEQDLQSHQLDADLDFIQNAREDMRRLLEHVRGLDSSAGSTLDSPSTEAEMLKSMQVSFMEMAALVERYRGALEFYGTYDNYRKPNPPPASGAGGSAAAAPAWVGNDLGRRARELLGWPEPGAPANP